MYLKLTNTVTGKQFLANMAACDIVEINNTDGVSTALVFNGGSMNRSVGESIADIEAALGVVTPSPAVTASFVKAKAKKK